MFNTERMAFDVPHYGAEYKLEVVDANTDSPVGTALLSAQGLLQSQRDGMLSGGPGRLLLGLLRPSSDLRRVKIELRTGVRTGFGLDYYASTETSGWVEVDVRLDEDRSMFYSAAPRRCPPRDGEDFDVALIQLHIARIGRLLEDLKKMAEAYFYVVSWESRELTSVSLVRWPLIIVFSLLLLLVFTFPSCRDLAQPSFFRPPTHPPLSRPGYFLVHVPTIQFGVHRLPSRGDPRPLHGLLGLPETQARGVQYPPSFVSHPRTKSSPSDPDPSSRSTAAISRNDGRTSKSTRSSSGSPRST